MRLGIRRNRGIHPLAFRDDHPPVRLPREDAEWHVAHPSPVTPPPPPPRQSSPSQPLSAPEAFTTPALPTSSIPPTLNGFRAQATAGDARTERLVRDVRIELADLKQAIDGWAGDREGMIAVDLDAVRANPEAAATLPPAELVRALVAAAARIAELERGITALERDGNGLRDQLQRLQDEHSYTRGRLETMHEIIGALHGNLEDLRGERRRVMDAPVRPPALRAATDEFGMRDQRGGFTP